MQKARCLCGVFSLILIVLLGNWPVTDVNAHLMQFSNSWKGLSLSPKLTRKTASETVISYRLDTWSQYDNPEEGGQREGDIHNSPQSRKAVTKDKTLLWPNGVINYYVHFSIVNEPMKFAMLETALHTIMSKTCIKFTRIQYEKLPANNWVNITGHQKGCFSDLGRNAYGPTTLNLDIDTCFRTIGHPIHEMLHTLGLYHEHMRPDRDKYITIMWENIKKGNAFNFYSLNKNIITDYGLPYDYDSIMHYSMTAFSVNRSIPTIIPTTSTVEIGQRDHMSYYDIQKLLIAYNCNSNNTENSDNNKKIFGRRTLQQHNKPMSKIEVKSQSTHKSAGMFTIHNTKSDKLEENKYVKSERSMDRYDQETFPRSIKLIQLDNYPVPLNPIYLYINFHFYFHKK
ncbi:Zinc metalloproteinase nas-7 [Formica fusca]